MPGIAGLISDRAEEALFNSMCNSMNHLNYTIDNQINEGLHLGRIHLNYINATTQPLRSKDLKYSLIFCGEIFSVEGVSPGEIKDSAIFFLSLIEKHGLEILSKINGQFSASFHDHTVNATYLVSDRFGTHPLYYTHNNNRLLFASEVKALLKDSIDKKINFQGIAELFSYGHVFGEKTLFDGISLVPPASIIKYGQNRLEKTEYWSYPYLEEVYSKQSINKTKSNALQDTLEHTLIRAAQRQSANTDKILVPLSGGLDSRYVAALYHHIGGRNLMTFTMGPDDSEDQMYGRQVAHALAFQHFKFNVQPEKIWDDASRFSYYSDSMSYLSGPLQIFGPLEYFSGKKEILAASQMCDALFGSTLWRSRIRTLQNNEAPRHITDDIIVDIFKVYDQQQVAKLFNPDVYKKIEDLYRIEPQKYCSSNHHPLHNYYRLLMNEHGRRGTLGGNIVLNLSFETRMLSYDNDVFDLGWQLPIVYREHQYLYRKAFSNLFPELSQIKRQGYDLKIDASKSRYELKVLENKIAALALRSPLKHVAKYYKPWSKTNYTNHSMWFKNELREKLVALLSNKNLRCREYLNTNYIETLLSEHLSGKKNNSPILWQIINLEYFFQNFAD